MNKRKIAGWSIVGMMFLVFTIVVAFDSGWEGILCLTAALATMGLAFLAAYLIIE